MTKDSRVVSPPKQPAPSKRRKSDRSGASEPQIGQALRSVYDRAVSEAIPDSMLDLLGRLD